MSESGVSPWVIRCAPLLAPGGAVLDLACGGGRHARYLAARGHPVLAVDRDVASLRLLAGRAGIETRVADLEAGPWPLAERRFAGIVVTRYLHRPLWSRLVEALADDGLLIYETFMAGQERLGRPSRPEFLLQSQELLRVAQAGGLSVLAYEEGAAVAEAGAVLQRLCARRPSRCPPGCGD